jgi:large subunit ribosomal protein L4
MIKYPVYNQAGKALKPRELAEEVFGVKVNADLLHQATIAQQANARKVIAHTKDRSEVSGSGKKPWKQKGTGRARVGSVRSPIWRGGGITFGPTKDRNFSKDLNKKMKQKALLMALSARVAEQNLIIIDKWDNLEAKTKAFNNILTGLEKEVIKDNTKRDWLIINPGEPALARGARNLPYVKVIKLDNINLVDLLQYRHILVTNDIVDSLQTKYLKQ